jgi:hypothetical protein
MTFVYVPVKTATPPKYQVHLIQRCKEGLKGKTRKVSKDGLQGKRFVYVPVKTATPPKYKSASSKGARKVLCTKYGPHTAMAPTEKLNAA